MRHAGVRSRPLVRAGLALSVCVAATTVGPASALANTTAQAVDQRQGHVRAVYAAKPADAYSMAIHAHEGVAIPTQLIDETVTSALTTETGDFRLAQLVRVLFLTDAYDARILPSIQKLPYWVTKGEKRYLYSTENHMALWMSSAYLMRQREGWTMDSQLDLRLRHFLDLKLKYGFYEYFSAVYCQRTLAALLNLADFAQDPTIKSKATQVASKLMSEMVLFVNDTGAAFHPAGRAYAAWYDKPQAPKTLYWVTTGKGNAPSESFAPINGSDDYAGQFVATTKVPLAPIGASRPESVDTTLRFGHPMSESATVHSPLNRVDRALFQMSAGGMFHPDTFADTAWLFQTMNLSFEQAKGLPPFVWALPPASYRHLGTLAATFTRAVDLSNATVDVYRRGGSGLTSIDQHYGGYSGGQRWPWVATAGELAVYTRSGLRGKQVDVTATTNTHLPSVKQQSNVALVTYVPNVEIPLFGFDTSVTLQWPATMDETVEQGRWIMGREGDSYVAVYRDDTTRGADGLFYSAKHDGRQGWATVVGDKTTHGSFVAFQSMIKAAKVSSKQTFSFRRFRWGVTSRIEADGKTIEQSL